MKIDIRGGTAEPSSDPVFSATVNLEDGRSSIGLAGGDPLNREGEPAFVIALYDLGRSAAESPENAEFLVSHTSPDAPTVDILLSLQEGNHSHSSNPDAAHADEVFGQMGVN